MTCIPFPPVSVEVGAINGLVEQGSDRRVCVKSESTSRFVWQTPVIAEARMDRTTARPTRLYFQSTAAYLRSAKPLEKAPGTCGSARPAFLYARVTPPLSGPTSPRKPDHPNREETLRAKTVTRLGRLFTQRRFALRFHRRFPAIANEVSI